MAPHRSSPARSRRSGARRRRAGHLLSRTVPASTAQLGEPGTGASLCWRSRTVWASKGRQRQAPRGAHVAVQGAPWMSSDIGNTRRSHRKRRRAKAAGRGRLRAWAASRSGLLPGPGLLSSTHSFLKQRSVSRGPGGPSLVAFTSSWIGESPGRARIWGDSAATQVPGGFPGKV